MFQKKKISTLLYSFLFLGTVVFFGLTSSFNLGKAYLKHEYINNDWSPEKGTKLEADLSSTFFLKNAFIHGNGAIHKFLGQREMNGIVKLDNDYLFIPYEKLSDEEIYPRVQDALTLKSYCDEHNIQLIYGITPYTSDRQDSQLPTGVEDYGNENLDQLKDLLITAGITPIDFREELNADGFSSYDMMYRTDHHWNTRMGFYAFQHFSTILSEKLQCDIDPQVLDINNYTISNYPAWHLGTRGQRTGMYYAGIDDFEVITPDFETSVNNGLTNGSFEELVIDLNGLNNPDLMSRYTYDKVLERSNFPFTNNNSWNDKKILVLSDSFSKTVDPFLILAFKKVRTLGGDIDYAYIEEYQPDAILMFYYTDFLLAGKK